MTAWQHDDLARDLASHLMADGKRWCWLDIALEGIGHVRPDVFAMNVFSYSSPEVLAYEVKISDADLRRDLTGGKWQEYQKFAQGVVFALPEALKREDIPKTAGLMVRSERGWRTIRRPVLGEFRLTHGMLIRLLNIALIRGSGGFLGRGTPRADAFNYERIEASRYADRLRAEARAQVGKRLGREIAEYLTDPDKARGIIKRANAEADEIVSRAQAEAERGSRLWGDLAEALGLQRQTSHWDVEVALRQRLQRLTEADEVRFLQQQFDAIAKAMGKAGETRALARRKRAA